MTFSCLLGRHAALPGDVRNLGLRVSQCRCCGRDLIHRRGRWMEVPRGFRIVWRRLDEVGLHSLQTGMDNVRGVCGCPAAGLTQHELLDATPVIHEFNEILLGNKEFAKVRREATQGLHGDVIELGFGSGLNLPHLPAAVTGVWTVEPSR